MSIKRINRPSVDLAALDKVADGANAPGPARAPAAGPAAAPAEPEGEGRVSRRPKAEALPWEAPHVRTDVRKKLTVAAPEPLFLKLEWLMSKGSIKSVNAFALELLEAGATAKLKELGVK